MHGVVAADTCTVPKVMRVSGEKSLINTHTCALGDEVVKISGMVDVSPLKFWCVMISPRSEIMALENLDAPTCFFVEEASTVHTMLPFKIDSACLTEEP